MSNEYSEHFETKKNTHVFYIGYDIDDAGDMVQMKSEFYDELFNDIIVFAFGTKNVMNKATNPQTIVKLHREALKKIYNIPEISEGRKYYCDSNEVGIEDKYLKRGEFGELLLYHLLHEYFNADSLISKIYFKDSANLAAHGFDAVHVDSENKTIWLGESKLYKSGAKAIDELIKDLHEHFNRNFFENEFIIINNRVDDLKEDDEFIKKLVNPDTKILDKLANIKIALFAGFDSEGIKENNGKELSDKLQQEIDKLSAKANNKYQKHPWNNYLDIYLFLFPLDSKNDFVKDLHIKLKGAQML